MRILLAFLMVAITAPAYALESPGLREQIEIRTGGYDFTVDVVASFEVARYDFDPDAKMLTIHASSNVVGNIAEITVPADLIGGNLTVMVDGAGISPRIIQNDQASLIIAEFDGAGERTIDIIGTTYLPEFGAVIILAASVAGLIIILRLGAVHSKPF